MAQGSNHVVFVCSSDEEDCEDIADSIPSVKVRRSRAISSRVGVSPGEYRRTKRWGVPVTFIQVLCFLQYTLGWAAYSRSCIEFMGGTGAVAQAYLEQSLGAFVFDIARCPLHDFLAAFGFVECLVEARTLEPMGLQHWDTVCSSWVWMVRSVTRRTPLFP